MVGKFWCVNLWQILKCIELNALKGKKYNFCCCFFLCVFAEKPNEVVEERPAHPKFASCDSNQDTEKDLIDLSDHGAGINIEDDKIDQQQHFSTNNMEGRNDQGVWNDKEKSFESKNNIPKAENSNRRRKQKTPSKVASYQDVKNEDDDSDITDDETQTYSMDDSIRGNGLGYEEMFSQNLAMETSSPIF